jgi:hypothetical protein
MDQRTMQRAGSRVCATRITWAIVLAVLGVAALCARPLAAVDGDYHLLKKVVLGGGRLLGLPQLRQCRAPRLHLAGLARDGSGCG